MQKHKYAFHSGIIRKTEYFDLFISYKRDNGGDNGEALALELYEKLTKDGFRVWLDNEEIGFSSNFEQRLEEAILHSKKVACIIGPEWLDSTHCLFEAKKAIEFEKRIIPIHYKEFRNLLLSKRDDGTLTNTEWVRIDRPQEIDYSKTQNKDKSYEDLKAVCRLHDGISLQHCIILAESYYWNRYKKPLSMLFSGTDLSKAKLLKSKCDSDAELPSFSPLQNDFVIESERFVTSELSHKKKVFIAFDKADFLFASELCLELKLQGVSSVIDDRSEEFESVLNCENVISVGTRVTPENDDLKLVFANSHNKRIIHVVDSKESEQKLTSIGKENVYLWNSELNLDSLITFINGDKDYNSFHAKLLGKAFDWEHSEKSNSKLIGLKEAIQSNLWYRAAEKEKKDPQPSLLMINFIERSLAFSETQRKRKTMAMWTAILALLLFVVLGVLYFQADQQVKIKKQQAQQALNSADYQKQMAQKASQKAEKMNERAEYAKKTASLFKEKADVAQNKAQKADKLAQASILRANQADVLVKNAEDKVMIAISAVKEAENKAMLASEKADNATLKSKNATQELKITELKIKAVKTALKALELSVDGELLIAKRLAFDAISFYEKFNGDFETDVLYNALSNVLFNSDTLEVNNESVSKYRSVHLKTENDTSVCQYPSNPDFDWALATKISPKKSNVFALVQNDFNTNIYALGLVSGEVFIYNRSSGIIIDTIKVGNYRITSLAFRTDGAQLAVSSVDNKVYLYKLDQHFKKDDNAQTIRFESTRRIEDIYYPNKDEVHAVFAPFTSYDNLVHEYKKYPATVSRLKYLLSKLPTNE